MIQSYQTAIARKKPSAPLKYLLKNDLIKFPVLDFGCGRGIDVAYLQKQGNVDAYDPYWFPKNLNENKYQTILCTYVLNVLPKKQEEQILKELKDLLRDGGNAYVTVRRDVVGIKKTSKGLQRYVDLNLDIVLQNKKFCIYQIRR